MLILTRRVGETIVIGDNVVITVLGIKGNQARIGINAPKELPVHREEIYQRIQHEKTVQHDGEEILSSIKESKISEKTSNTDNDAMPHTTSVTIKKRREIKTNIDKGNEKE